MSLWSITGSTSSTPTGAGCGNSPRKGVSGGLSYKLVGFRGPPPPVATLCLLPSTPSLSPPSHPPTHAKTNKTHKNRHYEYVPYFSLPANELTDVIAPSCYACFDYPNALADLVVGWKEGGWLGLWF
jgi:hypothetical protein